MNRTPNMSEPGAVNAGPVTSHTDRGPEGTTMTTVAPAPDFPGDSGLLAALLARLDLIEARIEEVRAQACIVRAVEDVAWAGIPQRPAPRARAALYAVLGESEQAIEDAARPVTRLTLAAGQ